jgi:UDP-2,3-diacylglucosamine pyrophosphatase LpxH
MPDVETPPVGVRLEFKTLVLSDVHLGTEECKVDQVNYLLEHTRADTIILNGDIIDGWSLRRRGGWQPSHTKFVRLILKRMEESQIIYTRGNHDDLLGRFLPLSFGTIQILEEYVHQTARGPYLVVHGDVFDAVTQNYPILSHIGDVGYQTLLKINRFTNRVRRWMGMENFSFSKLIKQRVKEAVNYTGKFEEHVEALALKRGCVGIMCGHNHIPADKMIGRVHYLNSGDWVEDLTCVVERADGKLQVITYDEFCRELQIQALG